MSLLDQVDVDQLADSAPLGLEDMVALVEGTADERITFAAAAWLHAYRLARWLGFRDATAHRQANAAWDRTVEHLAGALAAFSVEVN